MKLTCTRRLVLLLLLFVAGCGGGDNPTRGIDFLPLRAIAITSQNPQAAAGTTNQFTAIGHYGDPSTFQFTRDITSQVTWKSSNTNLMTISNPAAPGLATTVAAGTVTVTATINSISAPDLLFTVSNATLSLLVIDTPASTNLFKGESLQLTATGTFTDSSIQDLTDSVAWTSSNIGTATVNDTVPNKGLVQVVDLGTTVIGAIFEGKSATITLNVTGLASIAVTAVGGSTTLAQGTSLQLKATGTFSDATTRDLTSQVTWVSDSLAFATIDNAGRLRAVAPGLPKVTATLTGVTSPAVTFTVSDATLVSLTITPEALGLPAGQTSSLTATAVFSDTSSQNVTNDVEWNSSDPTIATVSLGEVTVSSTAVTDTTVIITAKSTPIPTTAGTTVTSNNSVVTVQ